MSSLSSSDEETSTRTGDALRRQSVEPSALDTTRLRPSILLRNDNAADIIDDCTRGSEEAQEEDAPALSSQPTVSEPGVLATPNGSATVSPRNSSCLSIAGTPSTVSSRTSQSNHNSTASAPDNQAFAKTDKRETRSSIRRDSRLAMVIQIADADLVDSEPAGLSKGLPSRKFPRSSSQVRTSFSTALDIPLPDPLPEPTPQAQSLPGTYASSGTLSTDVDPVVSQDHEPMISQEVEDAPPLLLEATLVVPSVDEWEEVRIDDTAEEVGHACFDRDMPAIAAEQAKLADLLQNPRLKCFLGGLICCIVGLATVLGLALASQVSSNNFGMPMEEGNITSKPTLETSAAQGETEASEDGDVLLENLESFAENIDEGLASVNDDFWTNPDSDNFWTSPGNTVGGGHENGAMGDSTTNNIGNDFSLEDLSTAHQESFRQYLLFDQVPQWNETTRGGFQAKAEDSMKRTLIEALTYIPIENKTKDLIKGFIANNPVVECLIIDIKTYPVESFKIEKQNGPSRHRKLPLDGWEYAGMNETILSPDLWETDVLYQLHWQNVLGEWSRDFGVYFPRNVEDNMAQLVTEHTNIWGSQLLSITPPLALRVVDDDGDDDAYSSNNGVSAVGFYRQRFIVDGKEEFTTAIFENILEVYSFRFLLDLVSNLIEGINPEDIETECEVQVTSTSQFPKQQDYSPTTGMEPKIQFVYYTILWTPQDWVAAKPGNIAAELLPQLFQAYVNHQLSELTRNLVNPGLPVIQSRPVAVVGALEEPPILHGLEEELQVLLAMMGLDSNVTMGTSTNNTGYYGARGYYLLKVVGQTDELSGMDSLDLSATTLVDVLGGVVVNQTNLPPRLIASQLVNATFLCGSNQGPDINETVAAPFYCEFTFVIQWESKSIDVSWYPNMFLSNLNERLDQISSNLQANGLTVSAQEVQFTKDPEMYSRPPE